MRICVVITYRRLASSYCPRKFSQAHRNILYLFSNMPGIKGNFTAVLAIQLSVITSLVPESQTNILPNYSDVLKCNYSSLIVILFLSYQNLGVNSKWPISLASMGSTPPHTKIKIKVALLLPVEVESVISISKPWNGINYIHSSKGKETTPSRYSPRFSPSPALSGPIILFS